MISIDFKLFFVWFKFTNDDFIKIKKILSLCFSSEFVNSEMQRVKTNPEYKMSINVNVSRQEAFDFLLVRVDAYSSDAKSVSFDHSNSTNPEALGEDSERAIMKKLQLLAAC